MPFHKCCALPLERMDIKLTQSIKKSSSELSINKNTLLVVSSEGIP